MFKKTLPLLVLPFTLFACDNATGDLPGVDPAEIGAPTGKADGPEFSVGSSGAFDVVQLRGDAATDLFAVMDRAGGFSKTSRGSLDYVYGTYSICVSNGDAAACNVYSRDVEDSDAAPFLFKLHGPRFDSAASEVFAALARASGVAPSATDLASSDRFVCAKTSTDVWCGLNAPTSNGPTLELSFEGLPALGDDFVYEGWLITADGPITSGRFDITEGTDVVTMPIDKALADASTLFVLTIEPKFGDVPEPSSTHIVAGEFVGGQAVLDTTHGAALGSDFLASSGGFILETPSTADIAGDFAQGVWFLDPSAGPGPGLDLPVLPAGWAYEGWVVGQDGPVSTGRFVDVADADRDGAGPTAGPDGSPPFPGQDFINPPMDLTENGTMVVISVEPEPDDSALPFALKPLAGPVVDAGPGGFQDLGNIAGSNRITGLAVLK